MLCLYFVLSTTLLIASFIYILQLTFQPWGRRGKCRKESEEFYTPFLKQQEVGSDVCKTKKRGTCTFSTTSKKLKSPTARKVKEKDKMNCLRQKKGTEKKVSEGMSKEQEIDEKEQEKTIHHRLKF